MDARLFIAAWIGATVLLAAIAWPVHLYRDFDFIGMWLAGRGVLQGTDFYDPATWQDLNLREGSAGYAYLAGTGFGYAMPAALLMVPFGALPLALAAPLWATTTVALTVSGIYALARTLFRDSFRRDLALMLGLTLSSAPFWVSLVTGQASGLIMPIAAHGTALLATGRPTAAGVVLGLGLLKPHLFVWAIPILLLASPARVALARGMLLTGGALLLASFAIRPDWVGAWLASASQLQALDVSRANAWGVAPPDARWLGWLPLALVLTAFIVWWRARPPIGWLWAGALAVSLFGAAYSYGHDHGLLAVPATLIVAGAAARGPASRASMLVALAFVWVVIPWILQIETHRTGAEPAVAVVPVAVLTLLIAAYRGRGEP